MINFLGIFIMSPFQNMDYKKKSKGREWGLGAGGQCVWRKTSNVFVFFRFLFFRANDNFLPLKTGGNLARCIQSFRI